MTDTGVFGLKLTLWIRETCKGHTGSTRFHLFDYTVTDGGHFHRRHLYTRVIVPFQIRPNYDTCVEMPPAEMPPICDSIIEHVESGGSGVSLACLSDPKCKFQAENPGVRHR